MRVKLLLAILILVGGDSYAQQKGYDRTPAIYHNIVLFTAEGDPWKYDLSNGVTSRLTTDQGWYTILGGSFKIVSYPNNMINSRADA